MHPHSTVRGFGQSLSYNSHRGGGESNMIKTQIFWVSRKRFEHMSNSSNTGVKFWSPLRRPVGLVEANTLGATSDQERARSLPGPNSSHFDGFVAQMWFSMTFRGKAFFESDGTGSSDPDEEALFRNPHSGESC